MLLILSVTSQAFTTLVAAKVKYTSFSTVYQISRIKMFDEIKVIFADSGLETYYEQTLV